MKNYRKYLTLVIENQEQLAELEIVCNTYSSYNADVYLSTTRISPVHWTHLFKDNVNTSDVFFKSLMKTSVVLDTI